MRPNLVGPGEPDVELHEEPVQKPRRKVVGKRNPECIEMRALKIEEAI